MSEYYDGTKLLSMKDINGNTPEIFICTTNRTGGKTTYFGRLLINRFKKDWRNKFVLLYRYNYELPDVANKFFKDLNKLFFPDDEMKNESVSKGVYYNLYFNGVNCGYAIALNGADQIKKYSHVFSDVKSILFDEFQSETNRYCKDETKKFISVHTSIARGNGEMSRYVPVYMLGNPVSIINPYYSELGISARLDDKTRFLKGDGYVVEQGYVDAASRAQESSLFNRAFANNDYTAYSQQGIYLNDNHAFLEKPEGKGIYVCTIKYMSREYAVREYSDSGIMYVDDRVDGSFKLKIAVTTDDHNINYVMLKHNDVMIQNLRYFFERGAFRFKDLHSKEALLTAISY